jgi:uncharacterized RDD family membrane protein YckC
METTLPVEQYPVQAKGKRFGIRAVAYIIDSVIYLAVNYGVLFVVGLVIGMALALSGRQFTVDEQSTKWLNYAVSFVLAMLYFAIFEWLYGATPGKLILGMRVVQEDGGPCSLKAALIRGLLRIIDGFIFGAVAYSFMSAPLYQRLGDKNAETVVVSSQEGLIQPGRAWWWFLIASGIYLAVNVIVAFLQIMAMIR